MSLRNENIDTSLHEPAEEQEVGDSWLEFEGGEKAIIAAVKQEMTEKAGEVIEVETDEDEGPGSTRGHGFLHRELASSSEMLILHFHWSL